MKKLNGKISAATALTMVLLLTGTTFPDRALTATGVLEEGEDYIHFDLTLTVNISRTAFNLTKKSFEDEREIWVSKWDAWKNLWEGRREQRWVEWIRGWRSWAESWREEWAERWRTEWNETWEPEWAERWENWDEWMQNWRERWRETRLEETERIPEFIRPTFRERMAENFRNLWQRHIRASDLESCWATPASRLGLKMALGKSLNKTLQRLYNTSDVYVKNFNLTIELLTKTTLIDDTFMTTGIFDLTKSFDLYGVVIQNSSGTFIRSQFRRFNVTEEVDGAKFGYLGWRFIPGKSMFLDLSVFGVPLEEWDKTYDPNTETTTFSLVKDINVTTPFGNVIIDPELSLVVPGEANGAGDLIAITPILPTDLLPIRIIAPVAVVATVAVVAYYLMKRKTIMPGGPSGLP